MVNSKQDKSCGLVHKDNTEAFWSEVGEYKDASGCNPFLELFQCAISALILPHSNAEIERVFSAMNYVKSKTKKQNVTAAAECHLNCKIWVNKKRRVLFHLQVSTKSYYRDRNNGCLPISEPVNFSISSHRSFICRRY